MAVGGYRVIVRFWRGQEEDKVGAGRDELQQGATFIGLTCITGGRGWQGRCLGSQQGGLSVSRPDGTRSIEGKERGHVGTWRTSGRSVDLPRAKGRFKKH